MLIIRLQRTGKRNQSDFRIVLAEKASHVSKKVTEILGNYNPSKKLFIIKNPEKLQYWISKRVEISPTVHNMLVEKGLLKADKVKAFNIPKKPVEAEAPAPQATAEAAPEAAAEPVAEAPAEPAEAPAEPATEAPSEPKA